MIAEEPPTLAEQVCAANLRAWSALAPAAGVLEAEIERRRAAWQALQGEFAALWAEPYPAIRCDGGCGKNLGQDEWYGTGDGRALCLDCRDAPYLTEDR